MNSTILTVAISAAGLILSVLYNVWNRASSEGVDKKSMMVLTGNVQKLMDQNEDRLVFQSGALEFIGTQKKWNDKMETRVENVTEKLNEMKGREDGRRTH